MERREFLKGLLRDISGVYVEVGTCWGGFAEWLLMNTGVSHLVCVDPYKLFPQDLYCDTLNFQAQPALDAKYERVKERLSKNPAKKPVSIARTTSWKASQMILDNTLSFVYIDGNHHHREVLTDLVCWWPKVRKGGLLCGDDVESLKIEHNDDGDAFIQHAPGAFGYYGVATALEDFKKVCPDFRYSLVNNQFVAYK